MTRAELRLNEIATNDTNTTVNYENQLIREMTEGPTRWCSACERDAEDCVCEELSDHLRETVNPDSDVSVPAESGVHTNPVLACRADDHAAAAHCVMVGRTVGSNPATGDRIRSSNE